MTQQAAQNQHYVPKFILRKFLANKDKERVNVFQKSTGKQFQTSIAKIMAERRFNEFLIDKDYYASFENAVCQVESAVLPTYEMLVKRCKLTGTPEENAMLGIFVAFQMLRTRAYRDRMTDMLQQFHDKISGMGFEGPEIEELGGQTENDSTRSHLESLASCIKEYSAIIGGKDFILLEAPKGRCFYLGDNPVTLHNDEKQVGFMGNIGLSVKGIQIYVPLTSQYMLGAFCPSILNSFRTHFKEKKALFQRMQTSIVMSPFQLTGNKKLELDVKMTSLKENLDYLESFIVATRDGTPLIATSENMDFYNAMQVEYAREFVVCEKGDFDLAKQVVKDLGANGGGWKMIVG